MIPVSSNRTSKTFCTSDGPFLIKAVRDSITQYLDSQQVVVPYEISIDPRFEQKLGCFVTLKRNDAKRSLRGCIGFSEPIYKLMEALPQAAVYAATEDPRFPSVISSELKSLLVEVSILTKPIKINVENPRDILKKIQVGIDGLVMKWSFGTGLLLPQVASELKWSAEEFLENLSIKAGAPPNQWSNVGTEIYKFQAQVFQETSPNGNIILSED